MPKNYILVTGAAGFIGSAVSKKILESGYTIVTVDNLTTGDKSNIPDSVIFINGNLQDKNVFQELESYRFYAIIHIAGQSSGEISFDDPVYDLQSNTQSTLMLIKLALNSNCKKFIYASTMSVYGDQDDIAITENFIPNPKSFYSVGKLASEHYMSIYQNYGINFISLRLFNVYGPGQNLKNMRQGMVSIFLSQAINENKIIVKGDSKRYRDMVYIDDVVNAFELALNSNLSGHNIFNVCTGIKTTVGEVIENIKKLHKYELDVQYLGNTPGDIFGIYGSYDLINKKLKWTPQINFTEGLERMYNWSINL